MRYEGYDDDMTSTVPCGMMIYPIVWESVFVCISFFFPLDF